MRVKTPAESKYPWDYLTVVAKIPAADAFRPPGAGGCTLGNSGTSGAAVDAVADRVGSARSRAPCSPTCRGGGRGRTETGQQMIAEKDNLCYKIPASKSIAAMERIAHREFIRSPSREKIFLFQSLVTH